MAYDNLGAKAPLFEFGAMPPNARRATFLLAAVFACAPALTGSALAQALPTYGGAGGTYGLSTATPPAGGQSQASSAGGNGQAGSSSTYAIGGGGGGAGTTGGIGGAGAVPAGFHGTSVYAAGGSGGNGGANARLITSAGTTTIAGATATGGGNGGDSTQVCILSLTCSSGTGGGGGAGGFGVVVTTPSGANTLNVTANVAGGSGGAGGRGDTDGGNGGDGGYGIYFVNANPGGVLNNNTALVTIQGGNGGIAQGFVSNAVVANDVFAGSGGAGGVGVSVYGTSASPFTINNAGTISGGTGGNSNSGGAAILGGYLVINNSGTIAGGGGGGAGPAGILNLFGATLQITNSGTITGGAGGASSAGGAGIFSFGPLGLSNTGTITGGAAGTGGDGVVAGFASNLFVSGGTISGGAGSNAGGAGMSGDFVNVFVFGGTITGGNGGTSAGAGINGSDYSVAVSNGTISGGSNGTVSGDAVHFTGGSNALTLTGGNLIGGIEIGSGSGGTATLTIGSGFNGGVLANNVAVDDQAGYTIAVVNGVPVRTAHPASILTIQQSTNATISGVISGAGSLVVNNTNNAIVTFTGTNTYTGGTTVTAGTLKIGADGNLGDAGGGVSLGGGTLATTATFSSARAVALTATSTIDVAAATTLTWSGVISGTGGLNKADTGTLYLTGVNTYTGTTEIKAGQLSNNGTIAGPVLVDKGATLRGTGKILGAITNNGTIAAGNSPGTLTLGGPLVLGSAGTLEVDIDGTGTGTGAGNYSRLVFQGAGATLTAGGTIEPLLRGITGSASNTYTPPVGQQFNFVHTDAGVIGSFGAISQPAGLLPGTQFDALYSGNDVNLVVTPISYANLTPIGVADTKNRVSLGGAINAYRLAPGLRMSGDQNIVLTALYGLPASSIGGAMDQIAGSVHGDVMNAALGLNRMFASATEDHRDGHGLMASAVSENPVDGLVVMNTLASPQPAALRSASPFWAAGLGSWSSTGSDGNAPGYASDAGGVIIGVDLRKDMGSNLGLAAAYAQANISTSDFADANIHTERLLGYGNLDTDDWHFDGELAIAADQFKSNRLIQIGALSRNALGDTSGWAFSADAGVHYGTAFAVPFLDARYDHVTRNGFTETGAGDLSLVVRSQGLGTPRVMAGADIDLDRLLEDNAPDVALGLRLAWAHDFNRIDGVTNAALAGSPATGFTALSSQVGLDAAIANFGASANIDDTLSLFGEYHLEARTRQISQAVAFGMRAKW